MGIRSVMTDNPKIGWGLALVFFLIAGVVIFSRLNSSGPPDSVERLSQDVTLRCTETGTEWTMNRGQFELQLLTYQGELSEDGMFPSPYAEGRPVAILVDRKDWAETVERIRAARETYGGKRRSGG